MKITPTKFYDFTLCRYLSFGNKLIVILKFEAIIANSLWQDKFKVHVYW